MQFQDLRPSATFFAMWHTRHVNLLKTKTGNTALTEQDRRSIQQDLYKLSDWSEKWEMPST